ncbi:DNA topology modulation protein FlaR [Mangrovibacillus cuniculi]|uniref:DNA topology modulation protein FlaR n=1 Tax=Mangrovibacillus cuniculi TaxID=2593652 RepID=UPI001EFA1EAF|nr:DNA topology modulation protein FlaR [Mangrovibacillus cuniculi]
MNIHIIGSVGSGKTTLARELAADLSIPNYEIDNFVWERNPYGDHRRSDLEILKVVKKIVATENWIIEGVHTREWIASSLQQVHLIILLDPPSKVRRYRIIKRFFRQLVKLEKANYKPSWKIFMNMFKWDAQFERNGKASLYRMCRGFESKIVVVKSKDEATMLVKREWKKSC